MSSSFARQLLAQYPIISDQVEARELAVILREFEASLWRADGDVVEFGCYCGTTSLFLARLLAKLAPQRRLHVYDSFAGLPAKTREDMSPAGIQFQAGELQASKTAFIRRFQQAGLALPVIHKGWFQELDAADLPPRIGFAFLDGDYYQSITDSLRLVAPRLTTGAVVVVDDYQSEALPGVRLAVDEWLHDRPAAVRLEASLAIVTPKTP